MWSMTSGEQLARLRASSFPPERLRARKRALAHVCVATLLGAQSLLRGAELVLPHANAALIARVQQRSGRAGGAPTLSLALAHAGIVRGGCSHRQTPAVTATGVPVAIQAISVFQRETTKPFLTNPCQPSRSRRPANGRSAVASSAAETAPSLHARVGQQEPHPSSSQLLSSSSFPAAPVVVMQEEEGKQRSHGRVVEEMALRSWSVRAWDLALTTRCQLIQAAQGRDKLCPRQAAALIPVPALEQRREPC